MENIKYSIDNLGFETTQRCNLSCSYCYLGKRNGTLLDMTKDVADKAIDLLFQNRNKQVNPSITFWGGEPLLNFDIVKYTVEQCRKIDKVHNTQTRFTVITNGTILNHQMLQFFDREKIHIQISLDGNESVHNCYRKTKSGRGSFQMVRKNLEIIKTYNQTNNYDNVVLKGTLTKESFPISDLLDFYNEKDLFYFLTPVSSTPFLNSKDIVPEPHEIAKEVKEQFKNWEALFLVGKEVKNYLIKDVITKLLLQTKKKYPCASGLTSFSIGVDGKIYPCHRMYNNQDTMLLETYGKVSILKRRMIF